jgi:hypothetical protein
VVDTRWQLAAYVFVSIVLHIVAAQLSRRRTEIAWVRFLSEGRAVAVVRFVYYIGLPYIALILGVVPGRYLGLVGSGNVQMDGSPLGSQAGLLARVRDYLSLVALGWLPDVGVIAGLAAITLFFLSAVWVGYGYFRGKLLSGSGTSLAFPKAGRSPSATQVIYQAVHWSFYRSAIWLLTDDLYLGVVGGIVLVGGEWMLDSGWVNKIRHAHAGEELQTDAGVLIATSVIFFFAPNLWLMLPIHWLLAAASRHGMKLWCGRTPAGRSRHMVHQVPQ